MKADRESYLASLVAELCRLPKEIEWVEFKENKAEPHEIGEYISALSNSATLAEKSCAYLIWGISDSDHKVVGTKFSPKLTKIGNEELENWLLRLLSPKINFKFFDLQIDGMPIVILEVERAFRHPVQFEGQEYVRVGSYKKRLKDFAEKERELWRIFDRIPFESCIAAEGLADTDVLRLLDYQSYFSLLNREAPDSRGLILEILQTDKLVCSTAAGK
jgi:ATP-dependent DNA helicase RecG